jgi:hypothetical protein
VSALLLAWALVTVLGASALFASFHRGPPWRLTGLAALLAGAMAMIFWRAVIGAAPLSTAALAIASAAVAAWVVRASKRLQTVRSSLAVAVFVLLANLVLLFVVVATSQGE